jgi:hypothetical protein
MKYKHIVVKNFSTFLGNLEGRNSLTYNNKVFDIYRTSYSDYIELLLGVNSKRMEVYHYAIHAGLPEIFLTTQLIKRFTK